MSFVLNPLPTRQFRRRSVQIADCSLQTADCRPGTFADQVQNEDWQEKLFFFRNVVTFDFKTHLLHCTYCLAITLQIVISHENSNLKVRGLLSTLIEPSDWNAIWHRPLNIIYLLFARDWMANDAWKWDKMDKFRRLSVSAGHRRCLPCLFCRRRQQLARNERTQNQSNHEIPRIRQKKKKKVSFISFAYSRSQFGIKSCKIQYFTEHFSRSVESIRGQL